VEAVIDGQTIALTLIGGGSIGAALMEVIRRRMPNVEAAAEREAKRIETREGNLDAATKEFQESIRRELDQVHKAHEQCEQNRRSDNEKCEQLRKQDRDEVIDLGKQVQFLKGSLDTLQTGAPLNVSQTKTRRRKA